MKQAIVARRDLDMAPGKLAAQVAHASLMAYQATDQAGRDAWTDSGQKKVVLRADDEQTLHDLHAQARAADLPTALVTDAGHTQLEPGTTTALAVGPAADDRVDAITGDLQLY